MKHRLFLSIFFFFVFLSCRVLAQELTRNPNDLSFGIPMGSGGKGANIDLCPTGARVVNTFLSAWSERDYRTMYELIEDSRKQEYTFEQAQFDFKMLDYKPYKISSVNKAGDNYEFLLSYGDWRDGDKDLKKMIINGKTFKIIMPSGDSVFKRSVEDYF